MDLMKDGNRGDIDLEPIPAPGPVHPLSAIVRFSLAAFALVLTPFGALMAFSEFEPTTTVAASLSVYIGYLLLGNSLRITPDTSNLGLLGGLIDNPLRFTDDWNRGLLFFYLFFAPARFLGSGIGDMVRLVRDALQAK